VRTIAARLGALRAHENCPHQPEDGRGIQRGCAAACICRHGLRHLSLQEQKMLR